MMIAVLAKSIERALQDLNSMRCVDLFDKNTRKGVFLSGREFFVATDPVHLQGVRLSDYITAGSVSDEMVLTARSRMGR